MEQIIFDNYNFRQNFIDEVMCPKEGVKSLYKDILNTFESLGPLDFQRLNDSIKLSFLNLGITYAVYGEDNVGVEKIFPFDLIPRIISLKEWEKIEQGVIQRNKAINLFISDVYNKQSIIKDNVVPLDLIESSKNFIPQMRGFTPIKGIHTHISGTDLIRHSDGKFYVLEDNLRNPSGVSYVMMNRKIMHRSFTSIYKSKEILPVSDYSDELLKMMQSVAVTKMENSNCVLLTPGHFNSAYYEHSFLAQEMGIELVQGDDLFVDHDYVYMKTTAGPIRVDVIYRRIDDHFLDPDVFYKESLLGVSGLMNCYFKGNVNIINAPGNGFADDKAICAYVPKIIKYYLDEDPILENVPTYICRDPKDLKYVMEHLPKLVIKPVDMAGGYGVMICDQLSEKELAVVRSNIMKNPRQYIAQPKMYLSTHMTYIEDEKKFAARHIDLRTFALMSGEDTYVLPGGLTRVALKENSLIVNSSQGGGSKDTWVLKNS